MLDCGYRVWTCFSDVFCGAWLGVLMEHWIPVAGELKRRNLLGH